MFGPTILQNELCSSIVSHVIQDYVLVGERDTLWGNTIENRGYLFIYIFGCTYVILYFDPHIFLCSLRVRPRPKLR